MHVITMYMNAATYRAQRQNETALGMGHSHASVCSTIVRDTNKKNVSLLYLDIAFILRHTM